MVKHDCRSITGRNYRQTVLLTGLSSPENSKDVKVPYISVPDDEIWRIALIKDIIEVRNGDGLDDLEDDERDSILELLCIQ